MDMTQIIAVIGSFIFGIGTIALFAKKIVPICLKYIHVVADATVTLEAIAVAVQPDATTGKIELTADEVKDISVKLQNTIDAFKALKA